MSQIVTISFTETSINILDAFLRVWEKSRDSKYIGDQCYELLQDEGRHLIITLLECHNKLQIEGYTTESSWKIIDRFASSLNGNILYEGESLDLRNTREDNTPMTIWAVITSIVLIPITVIIIPFILIYAGLQIIYNLLIKGNLRK